MWNDMNVNLIDYIKEMEEKFPDRHKFIHKQCCELCPSAKGFDEETKEIATYRKDLIVTEFLFVCAWRPNKLCKGICDNMKIDQQYIDNFYNGKKND